MTSPPSGLNFTALWSEVDEDLAEPRRVAADGRQAGRRPRPAARRPGGRRTGAAARSIRSRPGRGRPGRRPGSSPPLSIRDRSSSSLTIWTRWPVSTSILPIRSRILAGMASPAASASRVSVSASRLTVVSGVRSSCDRLSMNSARICWSRRSSETSSRTSQAPPDEARRARTSSRRPSASVPPSSPPAVPCSIAARAIASACTSRKASISVRPMSPPDERARNAWAAPLAATIRSPGIDRQDALGKRCRSAARGRAGPRRGRLRAARSGSRRAATARTGSLSAAAPAISRTRAAIRRPRTATATAARLTSRAIPTSHGSIGRAWHSGRRPDRAHGRARAADQRPGRRTRGAGSSAGTRRGRHGAVSAVEGRRREGVAEHQEVRDPGRGSPGAGEDCGDPGRHLPRPLPRHGPRAPTRRAGPRRRPGRCPAARAARPVDRGSRRRQGRRCRPDRALASGGAGPATAGPLGP